MPQLHVHFLPELIAADKLAGSTCVVIDVLRATTTIITALAEGASAVIPCLTIDDARRCASALPSNTCLLGGERGGLPIEGFALGNSPAEYAPSDVGGKVVVLTTTNGTKALLHCCQASEVLIAALVNVSAICQALRGRERINILCAGTDGRIGLDDVLVAGAIVAGIALDATWQLNDQAHISRQAWQAVPARELIKALRTSLGGRNLIEVGLGSDIVLAAGVDRFSAVPRFHAASGRIEIT